jgi:hypothetical protein
MSFPKSPGEPASTAARKLASRAAKLESAMLAPTSLFNLSNDLSRSVFRGANAVPCACLETRQGFDENRNLGQRISIVSW